jgi:MerR family transcriptional regulator, repressor of the yfmOP operon
MNIPIEGMEGEEVMSIGDLAKEYGLTTRTLRYWEEVGIIESVERLGGAMRGYTDYYVRRIKFILKLKELGLTIKEMQDLYAAYGDAKQTDRMIPRLIEILEQHGKKVDEKMFQLASLRKEIVEYRKKMLKRLNNSSETVQ